MPIHVAILLKRYIDLILAGTKTVESRLTITPRTPYQRIKAGERIYFKASSGPFMANAVADAVEFYDKLTPVGVAALEKRWNGEVCGEHEYWQWKRTSRYATFVRLRDVRATSTGPAMEPSQGVAWFTMSDTMAPKSFETTLTAGAIRNGYVAAPKGLKVSGVIQLVLPDGRSVDTDMTRWRKIRWRGWKELFKAGNVSPNSRVRFEETAPQKYQVSFERAGDKPPLPMGEGRGEGTPKFSSGHKNTTQLQPQLSAFIKPKRFKTLIQEARNEDLGPTKTDITSELLIPATAKTRTIFRSRQTGRLSGAALLPMIIEVYDPTVVLKAHLHDGDKLDANSVIAEISGRLRSILAIERVALNFLTHLSGIASLTARFVDHTVGTKAGIYDTRKTIPGLRELEKYAVVCGGGRSYRMGLFDAVLVKDNHIAHLPLDKLAPALAEMIVKARARKPRPAFVMIEVDTLEQLQRVLPVGPDIVLLDNMDTATIHKAVAIRDRLAPDVELEVSGGVRLDTVRAYAQTGVDRISVGGLTHSAPALDIGLDIE